jgi:D-xylose 1-dehydrogenase (NADP+, D-xylono-1,5-lactone-forming)
MISTAAIGSELVPAFQLAERNELVAVASRDSGRARAYAERYGIPRWYAGYEALLADDGLDAVYIALPNALHGEWTRAALDAGKHVLCEKPLTPTSQEAADLFGLASSKGLVLAEAFMYRHHPKTLRVGELLREGAIGELRTIRCSFSFKVADPATDIRYSVELAGGALRDVGCYCVSYATFAADADPAEVQGHAVQEHGRVDEQFYGILVFPGGRVAQFDCALNVPLNLGVTLVGSGGAIHVPMPWYAHLEPLSVYLHRNGETSEIATPGPNAYALEIEDIAAAICGDSEQLVTPAETLRNLRVIELLHASAGSSNDRREIPIG